MTIPIVFATAGDAVASGLVASLAQPGGNVTGTTHFVPELSAKQLELLKEAIPGLTHVAILLNPANPMIEPVVPAMRLTAQSLKLELHQFGVRGPNEFEGAFAAMAARRVGALVVLDDNTLIVNALGIAKLASEQRLPASGWPDFAMAGGLIGYGVNYVDLFRRAATFVDEDSSRAPNLPTFRSSASQSSRLSSTLRLLKRWVSTCQRRCCCAPTR